MRSDTSAIVGFGLAALVSIGAFVAFWGTVIYVACHFIGKFW